MKLSPLAPYPMFLFIETKTDYRVRSRLLLVKPRLDWMGHSPQTVERADGACTCPVLRGRKRLAVPKEWNRRRQC
jgi:hypothetical protein